MDALKILNLYAGVGGNRVFWKNVQVTAVELNPEVAAIYQKQFPDDTVIIADAHQYLLEHFHEYDFIWSSPPCQTNSRVFEAGIKAGKYSDSVKLQYHDLSLYQQVLLLQRYFDGKFCIENVEPFYTPLIPAKKIDRNLFWTNFNIGGYQIQNSKKSHMTSEGDYLVDFWKEHYNIDLTNFTGDARQTLRNCVHPEIGQYILNCAQNIITQSNTEQGNLFS